MSVTQSRKALTLAIYPTFWGFGWAALEGPLSAFDWGLAFTRIDKNVNCLRRADRLIERLQPETLVLEDFESYRSVRHDRIRKLCRALMGLARERGVEVAVLSRAEIAATFAHANDSSRQSVAEAIARHLPILRRCLPRKRKSWEAEPHRLAIFNAVAVALTHYRLSCNLLLEHLRDDPDPV